MDLLAKTIITPPKIILNSEYLPRNLKICLLEIYSVFFASSVVFEIVLWYL